MNHDMTCQAHNQYDCEICARAAGKARGQVIRTGALDLQVCVPATWTDDQVKEFADSEHLCGTTNGWQIRREGSRLLAGTAERVPCQHLHTHVHIMLDA